MLPFETLQRFWLSVFEGCHFHVEGKRAPALFIIMLVVVVALHREHILGQVLLPRGHNPIFDKGKQQSEGTGGLARVEEGNRRPGSSFVLEEVDLVQSSSSPTPTPYWGYGISPGLPLLRFGDVFGRLGRRRAAALPVWPLS